MADGVKKRATYDDVLVDPVERTLEVLRFVEGRWLLLATFADDERVRAEPFDAIELELGLLWADVEPVKTR
jgi:Uma2 family endonuclease